MMMAQIMVVKEHCKKDRLFFVTFGFLPTVMWYVGKKIFKIQLWIISITIEISYHQNLRHKKNVGQKLFTK